VNIKKIILVAFCAGLCAYAQDTADTMDTMDSMDTPDTGDFIDVMDVTYSAVPQKAFSFGIRGAATYIAQGSLQLASSADKGDLRKRVEEDINYSSNRLSMGGTFALSVRHQTLPWFTPMASLGVSAIYAQKKVTQTATSRVCSRSYCREEVYTNEVAPKTSWLALYGSLGAQFSIPQLSKNFHIEVDGELINNLAASENFFMAANSSAVVLNGGLSYTLHPGAKDLDIGIKAGRSVFNNYSTDSAIYTHLSEARVSLFANAWLF